MPLPLLIALSLSDHQAPPCDVFTMFQYSRARAAAFESAFQTRKPRQDVRRAFVGTDILTVPAPKGVKLPKPKAPTMDVRAFNTPTGALVLHDSAGQWGWAGALYALQLRNLLSHFQIPITTMPVEQYKPGMLKNYKVGFYIGVTYDNALPSAFLTDASSTTSPFVWMGFNLWKLAWNNGVYLDHSQAFVDRTGFRFMGLSDNGYPKVRYKGELLDKLQFSPTQGVVEIANPAKALQVAGSEGPLGTIPYITKGGSNFWYVSDNPMMDIDLIGMTDRVLAFSDLLHDMTQINHATQRRAFIRIEDVSPGPYSEPAHLKSLGDAFASQGVPFTVSLIPEHHDPLGVDTEGVPYVRKLTDNKRWNDAIKYLRNKGGVITMHGTTHQYRDVPNPYNGTSGPDFEFFRVQFDSIGRMQPLGFVPEDSPTWFADRVQRGLNILSAGGFNGVNGWVTPHYMASPTDYEVVAARFAYALCRGVTFVEANGALQMLQQFTPFVIKDQFGIKRIPETVGYVDFYGFADQPPSLPADLERRAKANLVVRDGWAGAYYHWYLDPDNAKDVVRRIKALGYTFVKPTGTLW